MRAIAVAVAVAVDEVKNLRDKAMALEKYAAQANNFDAEKRCANLRIQAEMKGGLLLKEMEKAKGGGDARKPTQHRSQRATSVKSLDQLGISKTQSSR